MLLYHHSCQYFVQTIIQLILPLTMSNKPYTPSHYISIHVPKSIMQRCKQEHYYIVSSLFIFSLEPIYSVIGLFGNLYKVSFSKDSISCSCDYNFTYPCKHILLIHSSCNQLQNPHWSITGVPIPDPGMS